MEKNINRINVSLQNSCSQVNLLFTSKTLGFLETLKEYGFVRYFKVDIKLNQINVFFYINQGEPLIKKIFIPKKEYFSYLDFLVFQPGPRRVFFVDTSKGLLEYSKVLKFRLGGVISFMVIL